MTEIAVTDLQATNQPAVAAERNIVQRWEASYDDMDEGTAREWARLDAQDFAKIRDDELARFAASTITDNFQNYPAYKAEFELAGVEVLARVAERNADNEALVAAKEERKEREYAAMLAASAERAKRWTPEQAAERARSDVAELLALTGQGFEATTPLEVQRPNIDDEREQAAAFARIHEERAIRYERGYRIADIAAFAAASPAYQEALELAAPDVAAEIARTVAVVGSAKVINGTFVGKVTALSEEHVEQKIGRDPSNVMVHDRKLLSGDDVSVGHVVTVSYEMGKGRLRNHDLAVEQRGMGR